MLGFETFGSITLFDFRSPGVVQSEPHQCRQVKKQDMVSMLVCKIQDDSSSNLTRVPVLPGPTNPIVLPTDITGQSTDSEPKWNPIRNEGATVPVQHRDPMGGLANVRLQACQTHNTLATLPISNSAPLNLDPRDRHRFVIH